MPHKFNAARRHKFPKKRYRVTNWAEYTEILRRRGDLTIWVTDDTLKQWRAPRRTTPGAYSGISAHLFRQHPPICTGVSAQL